MATELPDFLASYLLSRGLFSDRFNTPVKEEKETEQIPFQNIPEPIIDGGGDFDPGDAPSTGSMGSLPSLSSLFGSSSPTSSSSQGLFGGSLPGFLGEMDRQSMASVSEQIARNTNYSIQDRIGGALGFALSSLIPAPLSLFGMAMNAAGYGPSFDPEENTNLTIDPLTGIAKFDQKKYTPEEPEVPSFARIDMFDTLTNLMAKDPEEQIGLMGMPGISPNTQYDLYEFFDQYTATPEQQLEAARATGAENKGLSFEDFSDMGMDDASASAAAAESLGYDAGFDAEGDEGFY